MGSERVTGGTGGNAGIVKAGSSGITKAGGSIFGTTGFNSSIDSRRFSGMLVTCGRVIPKYSAGAATARMSVQRSRVFMRGAKGLDFTVTQLR
jgi:hypothetical protein